MSICIRTFCEYLLRSIDCSYESKHETFISIEHLEKFLAHVKLLSPSESSSSEDSEDLGSKLMKLGEANDRLKADNAYLLRETARWSKYMQGVEELTTYLEVPEGETEGNTRELFVNQLASHLRDKISFVTFKTENGNRCKASITLLMKKSSS